MAAFVYFKFLSQNVSAGTETKRENVRMVSVKAEILTGVQYGMYWKYLRTCHTNFNEATL
jgi:hypothetical protein